MNIVIDIRCLTEHYRTGVGEYTLSLLHELFEKDRENTYYLFYNAYRDVSAHIPAFNYKNVHIVSSRWPNKLFSLCVWLGIVKLDEFIVKKIKENVISTNHPDVIREGMADLPAGRQGSLSKKEQSIARDPSTPCPSNADKVARDDVSRGQGESYTTLDVFFAPNLNFISLTKQTKFVLTVHDLSFVLFKDLYSWRRRLWHRLVGPKKIITRADIILTPSENTKRDVVRFVSDGQKNIQVLSPGMSHTFLQGSEVTVDIQKKYDIPETYILSIGTLEPRKNIRALIESFTRLPQKLQQQYPLVIAGCRGWKYRDIISRMDETAHVHYIGYVDDADKYALYKNAQLFVFPSLYEGFGIPVLEAMHANVPVLVSNRPALTEVGGDAVVTADPHNSADMAKSMMQLLKNDALRDIIISRQATQREAFSWRHAAEKFLSVIHEN